MEIGRNDLCPCGSGKKYKKCCINSPIRKVTNVNTIPIENSKSNFEYIKSNSKYLEKIISIYNIDDVTRAIFCINSWPNNRSAQAQALTINHSLCNIGVFGNQNIKEYSEFISFYNAIVPYLSITSREDLTLNDFGEVKINIKYETFPIILGTGHEQVYAVMQFLLVLARVLKVSDELDTLLCYNSTIINTLHDSYVSSSSKNNSIVFELPSEQFWKANNVLFSSNEFFVQAKKAYQIMGYEKCPIEMRHFFVNTENHYPLYNPSLLVDFYKKLLSLATEEECNNHINLTIGELIENTFNFSDNSHSRALIAPTIININTNKPFTNNHLSFLTISANKVLIAINKGDFESLEDIDNEIKLIDSLHVKNELQFCEMYYRKELLGGYAVDITPEMSIHFLMIEPSTDITVNSALFGEAGKRFSCSALDIIYLLGFMEDFTELFNFIEYERNENAQIMAFGGKSNLFFAWKNAHHHIASGAIEFNMISLSYGTTDDYVFEYYTKNLSNYPFGIKSKLFSDPLSWKIEDGTFGYSHFEHKGCFGFGGAGKMIGFTTFLFLAHNADFFTEEDFMSDNSTALQTIDELNQRLFNRYGELLVTFPFLHGKVMQILYMPLQYARKIDHSGFTLDKNKKYVYGDIFVDLDTIVIRYAVNLYELMSAIMSANDKSIESAYFIELIEPLRKYLNSSLSELEACVINDSSKKREVGIFTIEQEYYYSDGVPSIHVEARNFVKVRKEIAKVCFATGVKPGVYNGKAANQVIRKMQATIVRVFEEQISLYNKENLHKKVLNYYATQLHGTIINHKRYSSFKDLDLLVQQELEEKTRNIREKNKSNLRTAQYLLESNLAITHIDESILDCKKEDFENIIAFADWLVVLQDNADNCFHKDSDISIEIDEEFKVNTIWSDLSKDHYEQILSRKYKHEDYPIKNDEIDKNYYFQCSNAFLEDTGIDLYILYSLLEYLQLEIVNKSFVKQIYPNVFEATKDDLIIDFLELLNEQKEGDSEKVERAFNFITLDCDKLKFINGDNCLVLPVWDRENRDNRFDVKPILMQTAKCIFSPVVIHQLAILWKSGILDWYLPFEIGLENVITVLKKWKKRYEDEMVQDIASAFINSGFDPVFPEIDLAKRYPKSNFQKTLGDYDIIAIHKFKKEIWLIESKVLQKVGSIYEDHMQQNSFFNKHKDDEKFQKRIDYIKANLYKVTDVLAKESMDYKVVPYMVTNKLFISRYKQLDFPIITYHELMQKLNDYKLQLNLQ